MDNPLVRRAVASYVIARAIYGFLRPEGARERDPRTGATSGRPSDGPSPARPSQHDGGRRATRREAERLPPLKTTRLFGASIARVTRDEVVERIVAWSGTVPARTVIMANLSHARTLPRDPLFRRAYDEADIVTAGGAAFLWQARREGEPLPERVAGSDLVAPRAASAARSGRSIFLFGSTMERLHAAAKALRDENPTLRFAGAYAPPMGFERDPDLQGEIVRLFRTVRPDIILVALDTPKQEIWSTGMADSVRHGVFVNVGDGLEALTDTRARAPNDGIDAVWRAGATRLSHMPRSLALAFAGPSLWREHDRDRREHHALQRRRALARLSDERYRAEREQARRQDREAAEAEALAPERDRH